jgi:uncharacterized membrane protein
MKLVDIEAIRRAVERAESQTSGQIRVSVSTLFWGDVRHAAHRAFVRLGMEQTRQRNGILLFIVPSRRRFAVVGDQGIHDRVGQDFWDGVAKAISERFHKGDFTGGIIHGVETVGQQLAQHFPPVPGGPNELPDDVDLG